MPKYDGDESAGYYLDCGHWLVNDKDLKVLFDER